jgi:hypothetical protein
MLGKPWDLVVEDMSVVATVRSLNGVDGIYLGGVDHADKMLATHQQSAVWSQHVRTRWIADREFVTESGLAMRKSADLFNDHELDMWFLDAKYNVFDAVTGLYVACQGLVEARNIMAQLQAKFLTDHAMDMYHTYHSDSIKAVWPVLPDA